MKSRIAVPALPISRAAEAACRPAPARRARSHGRRLGPSMRTPRARNARKRRQTILAVKKTIDAGVALGKAAEHERAVRN